MCLFVCSVYQGIMDAVKELYDSQVSEDDVVAVLQCSQQYELDESAYHVVSIEAAHQIEHIRPAQLPENHQLLALDVLNAVNAAPRQPAEEREALLAIEDIVPPSDEPVSPASHGSRSRSRTPRMREPPIPTADNLPPLPPKPNRKPGRSRVPRGTPPRKNLGWDITRTAKAIHRCQLPGDWYQGGQNDRFVYTNDDQTYYINQQSQSMWVQGQEDHIINARMLASFNQARRPEVAGRAQ